MTDKFEPPGSLPEANSSFSHDSAVVMSFLCVLLVHIYVLCDICICNSIVLVSVFQKDDIMGVRLYIPYLPLLFLGSLQADTCRWGPLAVASIECLVLRTHHSLPIACRSVPGLVSYSYKQH